MNAPCYAIIPVRYASSRFPGKPLALIQGKPMFWHVYSRAAGNPALTRTWLATDDDRIFQSALDLEVPVLMTGSHHQSGTDRVFEAAESLRLEPEAVVLNIQGDEPLLAPAMIDQLLAPFAGEEVRVSTLARRLTPLEAESPDLVKVVTDREGRAMYFSRSRIPCYRDPEQSPVYWGHVGLYGYRFQVLKYFHSLVPGVLEQAESLEQLRLLESGVPIQVAPTEHRSYGVDRPEDLAEVENMLEMEQSQ
ncbi:MAG: 3-deoxy-manno-octulosonate cytidylyltransferase [Desulfohalobiaceae bacterium]|nr:3-deoxy-manno-octulosonate cytidylyltransferase [Desulfohalobiaceae bacterium]